MTDFILTHYLWIKSLHVIAVIAWMAGMLYLPRLFVYHADAPKGGELSETLKIMERRLLRYIINPAMIATFLFGGLMLWANWEGLMLGAGWMHAKLLLVFLLAGVHGMLAKYRKIFARDDNTRPAKFYRILNEAPTVLMIVIVILVIVKPF
jgi:putative membrane protein